jgi:hypothetical protein
MIDSMVGSMRRRLFRLIWYRSAGVTMGVGVLCTCSSDVVGVGFGGDSGCGRAFEGDAGVVFGRLEVPLDVKRDLFENFIVGMMGERV